MKRLFLKWSGVASVALLVGLYTAFVAQCFWNWFAVPVLHLAEISFLQMLGILWLIQLLTGKSQTEDGRRWEFLVSIAELCVPIEREKELADLKESLSSTGVLAVFSAVFGQIVGNTFTLVLGFVLHVLIA